MKQMPCRSLAVFRVLAAGLIGLPLFTSWGWSRADTAVYYAAPTPQGSGDCGSWANACTLPTALASAGSGDEVWVQMGVHKPTDTADRTISFDLPTNVAVYGGFAGTETQLDQRDWQANLTVLSGDIDNNDLTDPTGVVTDTANIIGGNSYHVVMNPGYNSGWLDGFIITAGQADGSLVWHQDTGGGLYSDVASSLTLVNTIFSANMAYDGGGMYCHGHSQYSRHLTLTNVVFAGNTAVQYGGGFNNSGNSLTLTHVHFINNSAGWSGGGLLTGSPDAVMTDLTFSGNTATDYGGGMSHYLGNLTLTDATFSHNTAFTGGGLFNQSDPANANSPTLTAVTFHNNEAVLGGGLHTEFGGLTLTDVVFTGNTAVYGGGMRSYTGSPTLTAVTFSGNWGDFGGGLYNNASNPTLSDVAFTENTGLYGAGIYNEEDSDPILTAVTFANNQANWDGGGMYNNASNPSLTNVVFTGNSANLSGGGLYNMLNSSPTLTNTTFSGNTAVIYDGGGLYNGDNSNLTIHNSVIWGNSAGQNGPQVFNEANSAATLAYSDVQGSGGSGAGWDGALGVDGGGNLDADPLFGAAGNLRLGFGSPAIDAGDNSAVPAGVTTDLDGNPRFVDVPAAPDTGSGAPPIVDLGAYEADFPNVAPQFTSTAVTTATQDSLYTYPITTVDGNGDVVTITAVTLPAWLTLTDHGDGTATLAGTPASADVGAHPVELQVTDSGDLSDRQAFTITVAAKPTFRLYLPLLPQAAPQTKT